MSARRALVAVAALAAAASGCVRPGGELLGRFRLQITGETVKVRRGEAPPRASAIFDGQRVRLRLARGDVYGVQVHRPLGAPVALAIDAPGVAVEAFRVDYVPVRDPSTRLFGPSAGPGDYPDLLTPTAQPVRAEGPAFFDVAVARDAAPGRHRGALTVAGRAIPVELVIEPASIDLTRDPIVWVWFKRAELGAKHGVVPDDRDPAWRALEDRYAALFRAHGTFLTTDPRPEDAVTSPLRTADLPFFPIRIAPDAIAADVARARRVFDGTGQVPFIIPIDEPRDLPTRLRVRRFGEAVRAAGGGPGRFLMAVTDRPRWIYGDAIDVFISPQAIPPPPGFEGRAQFWTYNGRPPEAGALVIDTDGVAPRTWGWIAARYRVPLWYAWEGLYYTDRYNLGRTPSDLMRDPVTFDQRRLGGQDHGNGEGVLAYPGPLPSLRLKALRRGQADRLLVEALRRACPAAADELARRVVPRALGEGVGRVGAWPADEPGFERARHAVLDALGSACGG